MSTFRCIVVDHSGSPFVPTVTSLLQERDDLRWRLADAIEAPNARADLGIICSSAAAQPTLLPLLARLRANAQLGAVVAITDVDCPRQIQALFDFGIADFMRPPLARAEFQARLNRALGLPAAPAEAGVPWLGSEETTLTSSNRALNALLVRLPRLARTGADVAIIGERGCGRTALARALAGVAGDTDPLLVRHHDELSLPSRLQLGQAADARLSARYVIAADLDLWPATKREGLARWLQEQRAAGRRIRLVATMVDATSPASLNRSSDGSDIGIAAMQILRMPALRERREDLPRLARHLVVQICAQAGRPIPALTPSALQSLMLHDWPGNLYEMRQTLARALQSANMLITAEDLAPESAVGAKLPEQSLQELKAKLVVNFERSFLEQLLHASGGNLSQAARLAGKNRRSLFELIRKHQIDVTRYRAPANVSRPPTVARATLDSPG